MRAKLWMTAAAATMWACGGATFVGGTDGGTDGGSSSSSSSGGGSGSSGGSGGSSSSSGGTSGSGSGGSSGGGSGSSSGGTSGSSSGGSGSSSGGMAPSCPTTPPTGGTPCPQVGTECEYGDNPNPACNDIETCDANGWSYPAPGPACPTGTCPATYADVPQGKACSPIGLDCAYTEGQCNCDMEIESANQNPVWLCTTPAAGCPDPRPSIGSACSQPGLDCDYGACTGGIELQCLDGSWQVEETACPALAK